jgi:hypothetical protein
MTSRFGKVRLFFSKHGDTVIVELLGLENDAYEDCSIGYTSCLALEVLLRLCCKVLEDKTSCFISKRS